MRIMLKTIREIAIERPWVLRTFMLFIAVAFVITMGWFGFEQNRDDSVVTVGNHRISREEYQKAYQNMYRFYKEQSGGEVPEAQLKEQVLNELIGYYLWLDAAKDLGVTVTANEMREAIMTTPVFQTQGKFDPAKYKQLLAQNRLKPDMYESSQMAQLTIEKAQMLVRSSVAPTTDELAMAQAIMASQLMPSVPMQSQTMSPQDRAVQTVLAQKQQRAVRAYQEAMKAQAKVTIRRELM
jgi:parvulin-like peptidyl-prolyl isomerase